jgi:triacylglycerol lipase
MAAICAGRCTLSHIHSNPRAVCTFGSPRIGNRRYVNYVHVEAHRWVNNNDIITRLPPQWLGYRHKGQEIYLNAYGRIRRLTPWQRVKDRWRGFVRGLRAWRFDQFADHSIWQYIEHIRQAVAEEEHPLVRLRLHRPPQSASAMPAPQLRPRRAAA